MAHDVTACSIDDLPTLWDGFAKMVRQGLGIRAFGVQIMDLPPDYTTRSHDETATGQEELYIAMSGSGAVVIDGPPEESVPLDPEHLARIGPRWRGGCGAVPRACACCAWEGSREGSTRPRNGRTAGTERAAQGRRGTTMFTVSV